MKTATQTINANILSATPVLLDRILGCGHHMSSPNLLIDVEDGVRTNFHPLDMYLTKEDVEIISDYVEVRGDHLFFEGITVEQLTKVAKETETLIEQRKEEVAKQRDPSHTLALMQELKELGLKMVDGSFYQPVYREKSVNLIWRDHLVYRYKNFDDIVDRAESDVALIKQIIEIEEAIKETSFKVLHSDFMSDFFIIGDGFHLYSGNYETTQAIIDKCLKDAGKVEQVHERRNMLKQLIEGFEDDISYDVKIDSFNLFGYVNNSNIHYHYEDIANFDKAVEELKKVLLPV